ncbi:MAG: Rieske (2Fe-2S) protein [Candidatus Dormibacteraceae bacterium]
MTVDVGPVTDFEDRRFRLVRAGAHEVGVLRWNDRFFAIHNRCPHQKGPVCLGVVSGRMQSSAPGSIEIDDETPVIACPWHGWEFDMSCGRALWDQSYAVKTVPVRVESGRVLLEVGKART